MHRICILEDEIADYQQLQQKLREQYSFLKAIITRAAEGMCVCYDTPDCPYVQFTVWNHRMTQITGYAMQEINQPVWYQTVYPDIEVQKRALKRMERMRQGENLENEHWEITCADGRTKTLSISTSVLTTDDDQTHVLALMQDITEGEIYHKNLENTVKELEKLLPICASCKKIRDDAGYWHQVEAYISKHSDAVFTHGLCPECGDKMC